MTVMSALPMTRADHERTPEGDGRRYELVDGVLVVSPAPTWRHQDIVQKLARAIEAACPDDLKMFELPVDCVFDEHTVLEPDIAVVRRVDLGRRAIEAPPVLAVEVLSPSTRRFDLLTKRSRYEAGGTAAYWVVDPDGPELIAWELRGDAYVEAARLRGSGCFTTSVPFPVTVDLEALRPDPR